MNLWTHSICETCWREEYPDQDAYRLVPPCQERCCFCGQDHDSGIYVRNNPLLTACKGQGPFHEK